MCNKVVVINNTDIKIYGGIHHETNEVFLWSLCGRN